MSINICGKCKAQFDSEQAYVGHTCPETGVTPADPANLGPEFAAISEAALARGAKRGEAGKAKATTASKAKR